MMQMPRRDISEAMHRIHSGRLTILHVISRKEAHHMQRGLWMRGSQAACFRFQLCRRVILSWHDQRGHFDMHGLRRPRDKALHGAQIAAQLLIMA